MSDETRALLHLVFILLMLLVLVGGSVAILLLWWLRGRDPHVGPVASYLSEPPDDLSPGVVGTLLDEHADHHDVLAALLGLGRSGALRIALLPAPERGQRSDYELTMLDPSRVTGDLDRTVVEAVFGGVPDTGSVVRLSEIGNRFAAAVPRIRSALYQELVDHEYFLRSPEETRRRWSIVAQTGLAISIVGGIVLGMTLDPFAYLAMAAGIVESLILWRVSRSMPRKTLAGAEAAARWRAFRTYLKDIRNYEQVEETQSLFDRYLPYAVAFGLERAWVRTFAAAHAPTPSWFDTGADRSGGGFDFGDILITAMQLGHVTGHQSGGSVNLPDVDLPNVSLPDVNVDPQAMADVVGGGLQGASDALGGLFDLAGSIFDAIDIDFD